MGTMLGHVLNLGVAKAAQGQGTGSIDPTGTHAFSGLVGVYPAAILWEAFHGTASPLIVIQNYKLKVWSPVVKITPRSWPFASSSAMACLSAGGAFGSASGDRISFTSSLRMNVMISRLITCPGTMIGKPGGYGITKWAETSGGPDLRRLSISARESGWPSSPRCARPKS